MSGADTIADAPAVELRRDHALGPDALAMIGESEPELASIYPAEVRLAFSRAQLRDAGLVLVTAYLDGRPVGCGGMAPFGGYVENGSSIFMEKAL